MILPKERTLHYLRIHGAKNVVVRLASGSPMQVNPDDLELLIRQDLAYGVGNRRRLSYIKLRFENRVSHLRALKVYRPYHSLRAEDSKTWQQVGTSFEHHHQHCEAFSPSNRTTFT